MDERVKTGAAGKGASAFDAGRRRFLKGSGGLGLSLSLPSFASALAPGFVGEALAGTKVPAYAKWEDVYRNEWKWDKVTWGSHLNICWPQGSCKFYVYVRNGIVWREEQAAQTAACNADYVDYNPLGCQKGAAFNNNLYGDERVKYPLKRVGERGEGKWKRVSWDEATADIADAIIDGLESQGSDSFILDSPHVHAGSVANSGGYRMTYLLDGVSPDNNVDIGDTYQGAFHTFGKMHMGYSADNLLDSELIFMTCSNWSYTYPSSYHFMTEARYKGAEVVVVAPDFNPTTPGADLHVPVKVGRDAAFWLGLCQVMIDEKLIDRQFASEQTDLPLLVRTDDGKFLSAADVEGGNAKQFYVIDEKSGALRQAPRGTLRLDAAVALEGTFEAKLRDGRTVGVRPVFQMMKDHLDREFTPEKASAKSGVPVSLIRELARKVAKKRTSSYIGFTAAKSYHGDLFERAMYLAMALSGNWGKPGTGFYSWAYAEDNMFFLAVMNKPTAQGGMNEMAEMQKSFHERLKKEDPTSTDEMADIEFTKAVTTLMGAVPPAMWLYNHAGYDQIYDNRAWADPSLKTTFGGYLKEAVDKGWWTKSHLRPAPDKIPQVYMMISHNPLRRKRSGAKLYPEVLFPKLKMIFAMEVRMSSSAMYADIVLPCAWYYEKHEITTPCSGNPFFTFVDRAVAPPGECKEEWEGMALILKKVGERARARGLTEFTDHYGKKRRYDELYGKFVMDGHLMTNEDCVKEMVQINVAAEVFPKGYTYEQLRKDGQVKFTTLGQSVAKYACGNEYAPDKPFFPLRWHVDDRKVYPTHTRRAQFYFDHDWYLEAGEALPTHKDPPLMGGNHPFQVTGGHPRVSIHSTHLSNAHLSRLHRGQPVVHMNDRDAAELGIGDGEMVTMFNDFADCEIMARLAPNIQPGQCVVYFWENYQYKQWKPYDILLLGIPKALHLAGGYEQFRYYYLNGSPAPATDRGVRVSIKKA